MLIDRLVKLVAFVECHLKSSICLKNFPELAEHMCICSWELLTTLWELSQESCASDGLRGGRMGFRDLFHAIEAARLLIKLLGGHPCAWASCQHCLGCFLG
jgi:hypothetical protein